MTTGELRAITIRPPWADAVVDGFKTTENRRAGFPSRYRGELLIHAGRQWSIRGQRDPRIRAAFAEKYGPRSSAAWVHLWESMRAHAGDVIGRVELVGAHIAAPDCCDDRWAELEYEEDEGTRRTDILHLELAHAERFEYAIRARGALGLWRPTLETLDELELNFDDPDFADADPPITVDTHGRL